MGILHTLGLEDRKIISQGRETAGTVTRLKTCWWIKVNTKHVRMGPLDGAKFPHIIYFTYSAGGVTYQGSRYVRYFLRCPVKGERLAVFYDERNPARYAVSL